MQVLGFDYGTNPPTPKVKIAVGPSVAAIYPEYLTDPHIALCPSDAQISESQKKLFPAGGNCTLSQNPDEIDASYAYLGWVFDNAKLTGSLNSFAVAGLLAQLGANPPSNTALPVPTQIGAALDALAAAAGSGVAAVINNPYALSAMLEQDADLTKTSYPTAGNGGGSKIYHLREGIERFLITDINNPGGANMAQSSVWIMLDTMSAGGSQPLFNHVPGGCNVLYMDGHVEFVKYVGVSGISNMDPVTAQNAMNGCTSPVLPTVAALIGAFDS